MLKVPRLNLVVGGVVDRGGKRCPWRRGGDLSERYGQAVGIELLWVAANGESVNHYGLLADQFAGKRGLRTCQPHGMVLLPTTLGTHLPLPPRHPYGPVRPSRQTLSMCCGPRQVGPPGDSPPRAPQGQRLAGSRSSPFE
jgi:hypothetical protein